MSQAQSELLDHSRESLAAAKHLFEGAFYGACISRAYYAMFYVAQAFLEGDGLAFSKHSATIGAFGQHFAKPERVPIAFHRYLIEAEKDRLIADYHGLVKFSKEQAEKILGQANEFLDFAEQHMNG